VEKNAPPSRNADLVIVDGKARGIIARNLVTGEIERHSAHAVVIASGGYGNVFFSCQLMQK
jgi:succinate dehydrogenase / fumarate reductase flavoprotein subunit